VTNVTEYGEPRVVIRARAEVGEGPVFDHRTGRLVWVDITQGGLFETDLASGDQRSASLATMLGAAVPRQDAPGFAVAVTDGYGFVVDGELTLVAPDFPTPDLRSNDAKCDSRGRLWAGSNDMEFVPGRGALRVWDGGSTSRVVAEGLTLPNGLGWNAGDTEFYLVDSMSRQLMVAPFDAESGELGALEVLRTFAEDDGLPDGLAVDVDGGIWIAMWGGAQVLRVDRNGDVTGRIAMPVAQPSSCAFGADGTLYITSATSGLDADQLVAQPDAGSVFAVATDTHGVPVTAFAG
jgi:sugar lactone lactonase YvrE